MARSECGWHVDTSTEHRADVFFVPLYSHDHLGNTCPYGNLPFKWFGKSHGWLPVKGWWSVSADFSFPAEFLSSCNKATWWAPSSQWRYPVGFAWPSFWPSLGWSGYNWAPSSFVCSGKGDDGFSFDHLGHGRPSGFPEGFLYFGIGPQVSLFHSHTVHCAALTLERSGNLTPGSNCPPPNGLLLPAGRLAMRPGGSLLESGRESTHALSWSSFSRIGRARR